MSRSLTAHEVRRLRLRAQLLLREPDAMPADVATIVHATGGMQAQDLAAGALAVRARSAGLTTVEVEHARVVERSVTRIWCMRGTLHLVATAGLGWLGALLFPIFVKSSRPRRLQLGLDDTTCARAIDALRALLTRHGPATRPQLREWLTALGFDVRGQSLPYLLNLAALHGVVCFGPVRGAEPTFVLRDEWLGPLEQQPAALALTELTRRYLLAYGPARPEDLAAWSGLPISQARAGWRAIEDELLEVDAAGQTAWLHLSRASWLDDASNGPRSVILAAAFDTYLLGYRGRELAVAPHHAQYVLPGGGMLRPTLLLDGLAAASWKIAERRAGLHVVVDPYDRLPDDALPELEREAQDVGRFLGEHASLTVESKDA